MGRCSTALSYLRSTWERLYPARLYIGGDFVELRLGLRGILLHLHHSSPPLFFHRVAIPLAFPAESRTSVARHDVQGARDKSVADDPTLTTGVARLVALTFSTWLLQGTPLRGIPLAPLWTLLRILRWKRVRWKVFNNFMADEVGLITAQSPCFECLRELGAPNLTASAFQLV